MADKIKIMLLATHPMKLAYVRLGDELREIEEKVQHATHRDAFELTAKPAVRVPDLGMYMQREQPHIVHFCGQGELGEGIILQGAAGERTAIGVSELTDLFSILKDNLRLVFFNVCYSNLLAEAVSQGLDYAIGMEGKVDDEIALVFAPAFYEALAFGRSVSEAFNVAKATAGAKMAVLRVRPGVDAAEPFLEQTRRIGQLKSAVTRLLAGTVSAADRTVLQASVVGGQLILAEAEDKAADQGKDQPASLPMMRDGQFHVTLPPAAYRQANEWIFPAPAGIAPPFYPSVFIGREGALKDLKQRLNPTTRSAGEKTITVVRGWPGVGKTTLVGVIGRDSEIRAMFPQGILWTSLEQKPNVLSEMARWGRALGTDEILRAPTLQEAVAQLAALLWNRQMLLIVDDVWETDHVVPFLAALGNQCALLVTTRRPAVAEALTTSNKAIYNLPVLTEENALTLLRFIVPAIVMQYPDECRELVRDLECLPLALHVAGRLLKSEASYDWGVTDLIRELREDTRLLPAIAPNDRIEGGKLPTVSALLMKSTNMLDEFTRDCFAYLGAFAPKPATFDLAAMGAVWEVDEPKPIVRELVNHGLLEPVGEGRFQMHRLLVDHAKSLCEDDADAERP